VSAYDFAGKLLWSYPGAAGLTGIDDAWAMDLDGDHIDEVIVGFNGGTGMHVLDRNGQLLWQSAGIGNVWHVSAGDVVGNGKPQVVTTSALGRVHVFSVDGKDRRDLDPGFYANMVRVGKLSEKDAAATILAAGSIAAGSGNALGLVALSADGRKKWTLQLESNGQSSAYSAFLARGKPWLAVGMQGGQVTVIDAEAGAVIASIDGQGLLPEVSWMGDSDNGSPLLIVSSGSKLNAYRIVEAR
jgi:hypothetical protein